MIHGTWLRWADVDAWQCATREAACAYRDPPGPPPRARTCTGRAPQHAGSRLPCSVGPAAFDIGGHPGVMCDAASLPVPPWSSFGQKGCSPMSATDRSPPHSWSPPARRSGVSPQPLLTRGTAVALRAPSDSWLSSPEDRSEFLCHIVAFRNCTAPEEHRKGPVVRKRRHVRGTLSRTPLPCPSDHGGPPAMASWNSAILASMAASMALRSHSAYRS